MIIRQVIFCHIYITKKDTGNENKESDSAF